MSHYFTPFDEDVAPTGARGVANQLGLRYVEGGVRDRSYRSDVPGGLPTLPLIEGADLGRAVSDLAYGEFAGYPIQTFTFDALSYRDEPDRTVRSCVLFDVPARLPTVQIAPHNRLSAARMRRAVPGSFESKYRVVGRDDVGVRALLDDSMQSWLAGLDPLPRFEISGSNLLAHTGRLDTEDLPKLVTTAFTFIIRIPDEAMLQFGGTV